MQIKCPACNAAFSLEAALSVDAGRSALLTALNMLGPLGRAIAQYLAMFRAAGRTLSFQRSEKLLGELQPMIEHNFVERNGTRRVCGHTLWLQGFERIIEMRDHGKLQLPLKSHGYLLEIVFGLADQAGAKEEKAVEAQRRTGARNDESERRMERQLLISNVRGELELGLIQRPEAERRLREAGISLEVLPK